MNKLILAATISLSIACSYPACANIQAAGMPCSNPQPGTIQFGVGSDAMDDLLACVGGSWQSMLYGKGAFPKNHPPIGESFFQAGCRAWTDAAGNAYIQPSFGAPTTNSHILTAAQACAPGGGVSTCSVDAMGLSNTCNGGEFYPW